MSGISGIYRKWFAVICTVLLIGSLLLTGCTKPVGNINEVPSETPKDTEQTADNAENTQDTDAVTDSDTAAPTDDAEDADDASLVSLRQAMIDTPQIFAAAFFGYAEQGTDVFAFMQESAPRLCEDLPFLLDIRKENIIGDAGYLFCVLPADENATVAVNLVKWNAEIEAYKCVEVIYRSDSGTPVLVMCSSEEPDTEIVITDSNGNVAVWYPYMDSRYYVTPLYDDNGESLIFDFTSYDEIPNPGLNQGIDSSELVGTWELVWTEVEGDRNEAAPGVCTIEITPNETEFFWFTYSNRDFPEENVQDRELIVVPGELYPDCSNDQWIGEVAEESGDPVHYALTLLEDGTLLLQTYWEMDGMPWVSYGWYERID